jgi:pimeloyl-ACP methyl ester carboxylesterase
MRTEVTTTVAARLYDFDKPTLIAWSADDVFFEQEDGARLAATIPNARLEVIAGARTFSMVDQPDRLADLLSTIAVRA